jgi:hypothetical protein
LQECGGKKNNFMESKFKKYVLSGKGDGFFWIRTVYIFGLKNGRF